MERRDFGRTGMRVSVLGFGGAEIGFRGVPVDDVRTMLNEALDEGLNVIDTAECYADSEEKIGQTVAHRRKDYFLFTKVGHADGYDKADWTPAGIARSIDRSLQRLQTDCVDLVQLHSCSRSILEYHDHECLVALEDARKAGKTRFIGYSGDGADALAALHTGRFDTLQTSVNVADQQSIDKLLPLARRHGMGVIAKRPIANAAWRHEDLPEGDYSHTYWKRLKALKYPWLNKPLPEAAAIALRFTLSQSGVHTAIVGTTKPGRWRENAESLKAGELPTPEANLIRSRWKAAAEADWVGQV